MSDLVSTGAAVAQRPLMVVDNAHVTYRVYASGKRMTARDAFSLSALRGGRGLKTVPALRGVSFTASEGETIGVVGHNGSGKSTLFRAMSGLIPTSEGAIWAADRPVLLGVNAALVPELSGENNIKLGLLAMGFTSEEAAAQVDEIADFAELNEFIHHPMRTYSSGMGARLRFAIASAKAHSILLIDEALAVGDRRFRTKSEQRIRALRDSAGLVMIVSHSVGSLRETCDRVLWVHKGELRADGPAKDVIADYAKWVRQPGESAVGAASVTKAQWRAWRAGKSGGAGSGTASSADIGAAVPKADLVAVPPEPPIRTTPPQTSVSNVAPPKAPAVPVDQREHARALPVVPDNPRDVVRRERYRRQLRERARRKVITLGVTGGAILLALGAGAGIALVSFLP